MKRLRLLDFCVSGGPEKISAFASGTNADAGYSSQVDIGPKLRRLPNLVGPSSSSFESINHFFPLEFNLTNGKHEFHDLICNYIAN